MFLLLGALGFLLDASRDLLFGTFRLVVVLNLVHLVFAAGILLGARRYLAVAGIASLGLWLAGVIGLLDWLPVNPADNWLHLLLGLGLLALLALTSRKDLGDDLERDLRWGLASQVEPDRPAY